jgi:small subunit ribosomal protein S4
VYGVLEQQFRRHFAEAQRRPGATGSNLLTILELRLDNVVYRLAFAESRKQARQLVCHGHFFLNGRKNNIPSALVREGDVIEVRPNSRQSEYFLVLKESLGTRSAPGWLALDPADFRGRVLSAPSREDIDTLINEQLIVEYYSR